MNRYMRFSKNYRLAFVCFAVFAASVAVVATFGAALFTSSSATVLGLSRTTAIMTFLFVPAVTCSALLMGINYWFTAQNSMLGRCRWSELGEY